MSDNHDSRIEHLLSEHLQRDQGRLNRIEQKIDKLSDTVVAIARAEEKLVNLEVARKEISLRVDEQDARIDKLDTRVRSNSATIDTIKRMFWTVLAAGLPAVLTILVMSNQT